MMSDSAKECIEAIHRGIQLLAQRGEDLNQYKLVSAANLIQGSDYAGPQVWRLIFKSKSLIPRDAQTEVGKGGELFVEVDFATGDVRLRGYGE